MLRFPFKWKQQADWAKRDFKNNLWRLPWSKLPQVGRLHSPITSSNPGFFFNNEGLRGSPPEDTGKHESIAWTVGIQTGVDKGQSSRQLSVCKRIEGVSSHFERGGMSHTGCKITWETCHCTNFCKPLQQQLKTLALSCCGKSAP